MSSFFKMPLLLLLCLITCIEAQKIYKKEGPRGMPINKLMSCEEFGKNARFNAYSVVNDHWFVFFYYATPKPTMSFKFRVPTKRDTSFLHYLLDQHVRNDFNWSATMLLMVDQTDNFTSLLVERGNRGQYWIYMLFSGLALGQLADRHEMQFKQTSDNKYIGAMLCNTRTAYMMSRINEVPPKLKLQEEAAKLGFRGRKGKSYLYAGHEWMPTPEANEEQYWDKWEKKQSMNSLYL